jgi:AcrR family transcriptional regulator
MAAGAKPAVQARSQETRDRLLEALDGLLKEKPFEAITVSEIAARAGVSPATIYQRFANRDAAIAILVELYVRRVARWSRSPEGRVDVQAAGSLERALELVALAAWRQLDELGYLMRPAYLYSRLRPDLAGEAWDLLQAQAVRSFEALLALYPNEPAGRDAAGSAVIIAHVFDMMLLGRLLHAEEPAVRGTTANGFARMIADLAGGYLSRRGHAESAPGLD